jgi:hypothetical protein
VRHVGIVTVAHAFQAPGLPVGITAVNGIIPGVVILRSDLVQHGLDVGLIEMQPAPASALPCLPPLLNPGAASVNTTINLLGLSDTDALLASIENWFSAQPAQGRALSYYITRTIQPSAGTPYNLKSVVLADGDTNTFIHGRSGAPWVALPSGGSPLAIALQSHGHAGLSFRLGLGTHLATALQWLSRQPTIQSFSWAWRVEDLP